ncbi:MAG: hypothetical protein C5B53_05000 [Candidatus Melainabacteria bacterium]|nr:MAG: hypothetical protein C5B53_05000 [Candidatus Melainabacteria bacterium]
MLPESKPVVLVAEDHPVNRKVAGLLLDALGVHALLADDGRPAIALYQKERPALILMDIMMPVVDGFHAAKEIRRLEFGLGIQTPIIACTALDETKIKEEAVSCGINDYLGKPYSRETLAAKIELWLGTKLPRTRTPITQVAQALANAVEEPMEGQRLRPSYGLEQLDDLLALFLTVTETLLAQLDSAIQAQDVVAVRRLAHEIRSGSLMVDAKDIAEICVQLEQVTHNWPEVVKTYPALALAFSKVREFAHKKQADGDAGVGLRPSQPSPKPASNY